MAPKAAASYGWVTAGSRSLEVDALQRLSLPQPDLRSASETEAEYTGVEMKES